MSFVKESATSLSSSFITPKEREKSEADSQCDQVLGYTNSLEGSLGSLHSNVDQLVRKNKDLAKNWFELGLACTLLGQYETNQSEEQLGSVFSELGNTADRLSVLMTSRVESEQLEFSDKLKDSLRLVGAVRAMMKRRTLALDTLHASQDRLEARQQKLASANAKGENVSGAEAAVLGAQAQVDNDKQELERITSLCLEEAAKFKAEKRDDMKQLVLAFVKLQIEHSRKVQQAWEQMLPALE